MTDFSHFAIMAYVYFIFSVKNGKEIQRILNERNRDESNVPAGASGIAVNETGNSESGVANQTKQSTRLEQEMTVNQSDGQPTAPEDHLPSFQQAHGQPEVPEQSLQQDFPPPPAQNESIGRVPSPPRPEIPSMASLNLNEPNSSRSERSSQYSFTSQDARQSLSFELTKTGQCTFEDVASKVRAFLCLGICYTSYVDSDRFKYFLVERPPTGRLVFLSAPGDGQGRTCDREPRGTVRRNQNTKTRKLHVKFLFISQFDQKLCIYCPY